MKSSSKPYAKTAVFFRRRIPPPTIKSSIANVTISPRPSLHLFTHLPSSLPHSLSSSPSPSTIVVATFTVPVAVVLRRSFPAESATKCGPYVRDREQENVFDDVAIVLYPGIEPQLLATHARLAECRGYCSILVQQRGGRKH